MDQSGKCHYVSLQFPFGVALNRKQSRFKSVFLITFWTKVYSILLANIAMKITGIICVLSAGALQPSGSHSKSIKFWCKIKLKIITGIHCSNIAQIIVIIRKVFEILLVFKSHSSVFLLVLLRGISFNNE